MADRPEHFTIAELAARTGLSVRTIRFYTGMALIPPPQVLGRTGHYDERHVARLELVRDLQGLGFTLAAIEGYLARIPLDRSPEDLALHRALLSPWLPEDPHPVDRTELDERAGRRVDDRDVDRLVELDVLFRERNGDLQITSSAMLHHGLRLLDAELDRATQLRCQQIIERHTSALAAELFELFGDSVLREYREGGRRPEHRDRILALMARLKPLTVQGVVTHFQLAMNGAIRGSVPAGGSSGTGTRGTGSRDRTRTGSTP